MIAGTGETNSSADSYYGLGILRSADGGQTWTLISQDASATHSFAGIGFSRIAFSTFNPNVVVAGAGSASEGIIEGLENPIAVNRGIYYSTDAGSTWNAATVTDLGTAITPASVTSVVYNAAAAKFYAAVRYHGFYASFDGVNWNRLVTQPGNGLSAASCPTQAMQPSACPFYRGEITVVPNRAGPNSAGEMYVWFTDVSLSCTAGATALPQNCSAAPASVTPTSQGAAFNVTASGAAGDYSFNLQAVGTDAASVKHDFALTLQVVDFSLSVPSPSTISALPGATTGPVSLTVSVSGAFCGQVALACLGLPANATCNFQPSNVVAPTNGNPAAVTLTIATSSNTPTGSSHDQRFHSRRSCKNAEPYAQRKCQRRLHAGDCQSFVDGTGEYNGDIQRHTDCRKRLQQCGHA